MTDLTKFFGALSERAYKENDLSDVTYALCESDSCFRQFFIDFFFGMHYKIDASKVVITREVSTEWGRPDFYIRDDNGRLFIVEVKIWDGNHHFEQYYDILADNKGNNTDRGNKENWHRLGYIANYEAITEVAVKIDTNTTEVVKNLCARVATWKEFVEKFESFDCFNDPAIKAYVKYVKKVCPYDDFNLDDWVNSLNDKNKLEDDFKMVGEYADVIKECINVCEKKLKECEFKHYNSRRKDDLRYMMPGRKWFEFELEKNKKVWGVVYVRYLGNEGGVVCVEFENTNGWGKPVCDKFPNLVVDGYVRFYMPTPANLSDDNLSNFIVDLISAVRGNDVQKISSKGYIVKELLSMKALPMMLEQKLYEKLKNVQVQIGGKKYEFRFVDGYDAEVLESHCGRYFELIEVNQTNENENSVKQTQSICGWIGMMYSKTHTFGKKEEIHTYRAAPKFIIEIDKGFADSKLREINSSWYDDSWGWKCFDCKCSSIDEILQSIIDAFQNKSEPNNSEGDNNNNQ